MSDETPNPSTGGAPGGGRPPGSSGRRRRRGRGSRGGGSTTPGGAPQPGATAQPVGAAQQPRPQQGQPRPPGGGTRSGRGSDRRGGRDRSGGGGGDRGGGGGGDRSGRRGTQQQPQLAPAVRELEITDEKIFQRLLDAGLDLGEEAVIEAFLYFTAETAARRVATQLEEEGYLTFVDPNPPGRWLLEVVSRGVPTPEHIAAMGTALRNVARSNNGIYDGWWAVEPPEDEEAALLPLPEPEPEPEPAGT